MCITCGCNKPEDDHGNPKNITLSRFQQAADAAGTDMGGVLKNVNEGLQRYGVAGRPAGASQQPQRRR